MINLQMQLSTVKLSQLNAALAITGAIRGSSREKLYQELGLGNLHDKRWMRHLCLFYKLLLNKVPKYMYEIIPPFINSFINPNLFPSLTCRTEYFKSSFSPSVINDWNKFDSKTRNSTSYLNFINPLINFVRPLENKIFNIHDEVGVKLLTRLRLGFSRFPEHEFRHNFANTLIPQFLVLSSVTQQCIFFCASISIMLFGKNL